MSRAVVLTTPTRDPNKISLFDLDDTLTRSSKYEHIYLDIFSGRAPTPPDFFIEGALEYLVEAAKHGRIAIISHCHNKDNVIKEFMNNALRRLGVTLDAFISSDDIYTHLHGNTNISSACFLNVRQWLCNTHGKGASSLMTKLALQQMDIPPEQHSNLHVCMMGDQAGDIIHAYYLRKELQVKIACAIHMTAIPLYGDSNNVVSATRKNASLSIPTHSVRSYDALYAIMEQHFRITMSGSLAPPTLLTPKPLIPSTSTDEFSTIFADRGGNVIRNASKESSISEYAPTPEQTSSPNFYDDTHPSTTPLAALNAPSTFGKAEEEERQKVDIATATEVENQRIRDLFKRLSASAKPTPPLRRTITIKNDTEWPDPEEVNQESTPSIPRSTPDPGLLRRNAGLDFPSDKSFATAEEARRRAKTTSNGCCLVS